MRLDGCKQVDHGWTTSPPSSGPPLRVLPHQLHSIADAPLMTQLRRLKDAVVQAFLIVTQVAHAAQHVILVIHSGHHAFRSRCLPTRIPASLAILVTLQARLRPY